MPYSRRRIKMESTVNKTKGAGNLVKYFIYAILIIWLIINIFPIYWMFTFSLKDNAEISNEINL